MKESAAILMGVAMALVVVPTVKAGGARCQYDHGALYCRLSADFDGVLDSWMSGSTYCGNATETLYVHVKASVRVIGNRRVFWRWLRVENGWVNHRPAHYIDINIQNCHTSRKWFHLVGCPVLGTNETVGLWYWQDAYPSCGSILQLYATWGEPTDDPPGGRCQTKLTIWLEVD